ncbi:MAG: helix-turn-helix transcriptional regulator [Butyrivibrio sp.]|nr:helix-turn-helix transcriptional regulator [Butyrivibrio sp.]
MVEFGEQLRRAREEKGMTQQTLAEQLFVTRQAVSKWECGERYPDLITTKKISEVLDVSLDDLLSGKDMNKVVERNPVVENKIAEKIIFALYLFFMVSCLRAAFYPSGGAAAGFTHFQRDCYNFLKSIWGSAVPYIFLVQVLFMCYGFIQVAKGTLTPKIIGIIGGVTFATSSLIDVLHVITEKMLQLMKANYTDINYSIDILNSIIKPDFIKLVIALVPGIIGAVAVFFCFVRRSNKIVWYAMSLILVVLEVVRFIGHIMFWNKGNLNNSFEQAIFEPIEFTIHGDIYRFKLYIVVYAFIVFQAVALWIKKKKYEKITE